MVYFYSEKKCICKDFGKCLQVLEILYFFLIQFDFFKKFIENDVDV